MGIMDIFRTAKPNTAVAPAPNTPAGQNPTIPNDSSNPIKQPDNQQSTLQNFDKLWDKVDSPTPTPSMIPALNIDLGKLREGAKNLNFMDGIPQDLIQKAISGDAASFSEVINQAVQLGFAQSAAASAEITRQSLTSAQTALKDSVLPSAIRETQISAEMAAQNPVFSDPSVAPMLEMMKGQFAAKYPTASPQEVAAAAKEYLSQFAGKIVSGNGGSIITQQQQAAKNQGARGETDWSTFFEGVQIGDTLMLGEFVTTVSTVGGTTISANQLIDNIVTRTGAQAAAFTDTFDSSTNVILALSGGTNNNNPNVGPGSSFRLRLLNNTTGGFTETITLGSGMLQGIGTFTIAAGSWREFLFTILSAQTSLSLNSTTTNGSASVLFQLQTGQLSLPIGPAFNSDNIMPGCSVSGTNIPTGTTVLGVTQGQGGILGVTLSANATGSGTQQLTFAPYIKVDSIGGGTV
ncbi:unnamed protein product [Sphagnum jensenii]